MNTMKYHKSYKELLERVVKEWYIIVLFTLLAVTLAFFYNKNVFPSYRVTTTLLYKPPASSQPVFTEQVTQPGKRPSLENQVGIISSYSLILKTMQNLGWDVLVAEKGLLSNKDLYKQEPFQIVADTARNANTLSVPVTIIPVSDTEYEVKADTKDQKDGIERKIKFEGKGTFGKEFRNPYFHFTLNKIADRELETGTKYILEFADLNEMALDYQKKLNISLADRESDLIYVSLDGKNVPRAVGFLNELVKVYVQFGIDEKNRQADNTISFIDNQIYGIKDSLQRAGNNLSSYRSANRAVDISKESALAIEQHQNISTQEADIRSRLQYYNTLKESLSEGSTKNLAPPSIVGVTDPTLNSTILKLSDLTSQRELLSHTLQEGNPNLVSIDKEIAFTRSALSKNLDNLLLSARIELDNLSQQKSSINSQLSSLPKDEQNLVGIQRNFDLNNQLYTYLLQKRAEAGILKASNFSDIEILDPASNTTAKLMGHGSIVNIGIGFALGLSLAMLYFIIQTYFDKRIYNVEQIYQGLNAKVYGLISKNTLKSPSPVLDYPQSAITEAFRALRTSIQQFFRKESGKKVISVNSCIVGEGKSFITLNLAAILAKNNKKVLIIDTDLRKPKLHKMIGCPNEIGLSDYLSGVKGVNEIITTTENKDLCIISAGPIPTFPSELINNGRLEILVNEVRKRFDYVILKNAPVGIINDAKTIMPLADLNLFVFKMKYSTSDQLEILNDVINDLSTLPFGVVINRARNSLITREKSYGYYNETKAVEAELN
jgi:capsular exopolysaccharide synthesis family protein